jgi:hypothetical protein
VEGLFCEVSMAPVQGPKPSPGLPHLVGRTLQRRVGRLHQLLKR